MGAKDYKKFGISKERFLVILQELLRDKNTLMELANKTDETIAIYLVESIRNKKSFEKLECKYGVIPASKTNFYYKRRLIFHYMNEKMKEKGL